MEPTEIPDHLVPPGAEKRTIKGGDTGAADVEAIVGRAQITPISDVQTFTMLIRFDEQDLADLAEEPSMLLTFYGPQLHPFAVTTLMGAVR